MRRAVYPGSFNPPTIAHLDLGKAVVDQRNVDIVVWSLSTITLGKSSDIRPSITERTIVLEAIAKEYDWLEVQVTDAQLLTDIAAGFDVLVMGADKWEQINESRWYENEEARHRAIAALPELAVAPRPPHRAPPGYMVDFTNNELVSSTAARQGADYLMLPHAKSSGLWG